MDRLRHELHDFLIIQGFRPGRGKPLRPIFAWHRFCTNSTNSQFLAQKTKLRVLVFQAVRLAHELQSILLGVASL